jgi:hypothetical protein
MAHSGLTPRGITYTHDMALKTYDDQMKWIDALDTKAGILMAADGLTVGLVMASDSVLSNAPTLVGVTTATWLFLSLVFALLAFSTRRYEVAPDIDPLVLQMQHLDDLALKWIALEGLMNAIEVNESKVGRKAGYLFASATGLLVAILVLASFFIYFLV